MKTYKDLKAFKKRVQKSTDWADYFKLGGRMYTIYEYGGGSLFNMSHEYVCFRNKRTGDMITVRYNLPHTRYENGQKIIEGVYRFLDLDFEENAYAWR